MDICRYMPQPQCIENVVLHKKILTFYLQVSECEANLCIAPCSHTGRLSFSRSMTHSQMSITTANQIKNSVAKPGELKN